MSKIIYNLVSGDQVTAATMSEIKNSVNTLYDEVGSYKVFRGTFNQSGTSAPVVTEITNTTGLTPNITRPSIGTTNISALSGVNMAKVKLIVDSKTYASKFLLSSYATGGSTVSFKTYDLLAGTPGLADDMLVNTIVELRIYD